MSGVLDHCPDRPLLVDEIRAACAWVAARARSVRIDEARVASYAAALPAEGLQIELDPDAPRER